MHVLQWGKHAVQLLPDKKYSSKHVVHIDPLVQILQWEEHARQLVDER